jgi:hypothetical protein
VLRRNKGRPKARIVWGFGARRQVEQGKPGQEIAEFLLFFPRESCMHGGEFVGHGFGDTDGNVARANR